MLQKTITILVTAFLTLPVIMPTKTFARSDGQIRRDANGWLKVNDTFTGETCTIDKGWHVLFYEVAGIVKITARNVKGQNTECVATYPSDVFYMEK